MTRFEYDYTSVGLWMRTDPELGTAIRHRTELALAFAKSIAPIGKVSDGDEHPGLYRESLHIEGPIAYPTQRWNYRIQTDLDYAPAVERRHEVLKKTIAAFSDPQGGLGIR